MRTKATTYTRSTKPLTAAKKQQLNLQHAKLCRLLTWDKLSALPLPGDLVEGSHSCLWHDDESPSAWCGIGSGGYPLWVCQACQRTRDAVDLIGLAYGLDRRAAKRKAVEIVGGRKALRSVTLTLDDLRAEAKARPKRWPIEDARQILSVPLPVSAPFFLPPDHALGPGPHPSRARVWLESRGLSAEFVDKFGLAFAMPRERAPWWMWGRSSWDYRGYGLVVPLLSVDGQRVSFVDRQTHANAKTGETSKAKCIYPADSTSDGLIMANWAAWLLLLPKLDDEFVRHFFPGLAEATPLPTIIEIAEGVPDFLRRCESANDGVAVFGIFSGSWTQAHADKIPNGATVKIYTHSDSTGMRYQREIIATLRGRCQLLVRHPREMLVERRVDGKRKMTKDLDECELYLERGRVSYAAMGSDGMYSPEVEPKTATPAAAAVAPAAASAGATTPPKVAPTLAPRTGRPSAADVIVQICDQRGVRVRLDGAGVPCAEVPIDGAGGGLPHPIPLKGKQFAALLRRWLREAGGGTASDATIKRAVETLAASVEVDLLASDGAETPDLWCHDADNATRVERHVQGRALHTPVSG